MRHAVATQIRRIKALARAGDCSAAQKRFDALVPLIGRRGAATHVGVKGKTIARLWALVGRCRWKGR